MALTHERFNDYLVIFSLKKYKKTKCYHHLAHISGGEKEKPLSDNIISRCLLTEGMRDHSHQKGRGEHCPKSKGYNIFKVDSVLRRQTYLNRFGSDAFGS